MDEGRRAIGSWLLSSCDVVGCCHGVEKSHQRERERACVNVAEGVIVVKRQFVCVRTCLCVC